MKLKRMTLSFEGLDPMEAEALEAELTSLPDISVKALRTRDPGLVDSFLISLAANAVFAFAAVLIRHLKMQPITQRLVTIEMKVPGQYLKFESTDQGLDEHLMKEQITNMVLGNSRNGESE
jgi:hypothetical protein